MNQRLRVHWLVDGFETATSSSVASNRYRVLTPADGLRELGVDVRFVPAGQ